MFFFSKPFFTIIEVESFKQYNEDISETRFYYNLTELNLKKKEDNNYCKCVLF